MLNILNKSRFVADATLYQREIEAYMRLLSRLQINVNDELIVNLL